MSRFPEVSFMLSCAAGAQFPADHGVEIAFAGRSNAGKSSAINAITARHGLARTSKTPGRTQHFVVFALDASRHRYWATAFTLDDVSLEVAECHIIRGGDSTSVRMMPTRVILGGKMDHCRFRISRKNCSMNSWTLGISDFVISCTQFQMIFLMQRSVCLGSRNGNVYL